MTITGTIIARNSALHGGGTALRNVLLEVRDSDIQENSVGGAGGGAHLSDVTATFHGTRITENTAISGGGIHTVATGDRDAELRIQDLSSITDNTAEVGGGISGVNDSPMAVLFVVLRNSRVSDNRSSSVGGGIYIREVFLVLLGGDTGASIERNEALAGGGIHASDGTVQIIGPSVIIANEAANSGGGMFVSGTTVVVDGSSCMILGNIADTDSQGGGIFYTGGADLSAVPSQRVCLNNPDDISGG